MFNAGRKAVETHRLRLLKRILISKSESLKLIAEDTASFAGGECVLSIKMLPSSPGF
jgi:hypothetical protein